MFSRLLDAMLGRSAAASSDAARGAGAAGGDVVSAYTGEPAGPRDPVLPHPSVMIETWRHDVARAALAIHERHRTGGAGPAAQDAYAERLLVRLTLDPDMVVRQPPPAAQEALAVAADPDCELARLVRVVERDPALTRGLMRHASSAAFAAAGAPASIDDAVRRLGGKGVQVAVLAGMAEGLLARGRGAYSPLATAAWARMVRVGPVARALARAFAVPAHEAFLLGLLHDVGALVLFDFVGALEDELGGPAHLPEALAAAAFRELHEPLGGLALLRWGVDPRAAWAVAHHHRRAPAAGGAGVGTHGAGTHGAGTHGVADRRGELLYVATRLDAALVAGRDPALERWFAEGRLTAPRERVAAAVGRLRAAVAEVA